MCLDLAPRDTAHAEHRAPSSPHTRTLVQHGASFPLLIKIHFQGSSPKHTYFTLDPSFLPEFKYHHFDQACAATSGLLLQSPLAGIRIRVQCALPQHGPSWPGLNKLFLCFLDSAQSCWGIGYVLLCPNLASGGHRLCGLGTSDRQDPSL